MLNRNIWEILVNIIILKINNLINYLNLIKLNILLNDFYINIL